MADRDLRSGHAKEAMRLVEPLIGAKLDPDRAARARELMQAAGYQAADERLISKDFKEVLEIESRVARAAGASGRLANLRLQAERGIPAPFALAQAGSLTDYGYDLDGSSPTKAFVLPDPTSQRLDKEYRTALAEHPADMGLLVNYGQFLLSQSQPDAAIERFRAALQVDADSALAHLGLGLAEFEKRKYDAALAHFESAAKLDPRSAAAELNAGVCLELMGRKTEAHAHWQRALTLTDNPQLQQQIRVFLQQQPSERH